MVTVAGGVRAEEMSGADADPGLLDEVGVLDEVLVEVAGAGAGGGAGGGAAMVKWGKGIAKGSKGEAKSATPLPWKIWRSHSLGLKPGGPDGNNRGMHGVVGLGNNGRCSYAAQKWYLFRSGRYSHCLVRLLS